MPILTLIAGPNGSGKSTLTEWVDMEGRGLLLDSDAVAGTMNPSDPHSVAIAAGREVLKRIGEHLGRKERNRDPKKSYLNILRGMGKT